MLSSSCICFLSREYLDNIALVDTGVAELVSIVEDFFGHDGRTAYVFTSDHGMTNWGKIFVCLYVPFFNVYSCQKKRKFSSLEFLYHLFLCVCVYFCMIVCMCVQVHTVQAIPLRHSLL